MFIDFVEVAQHVTSPSRRLVQQRLPRDRLIVDDVAQMPRSFHPGIQIIPATFTRIVAERAVGNVGGLNRDRRCELRAGRFRKNSHAAVIRLILPRRRPEIVHRIHRDACFSRSSKIHRHAGADHVADAGENRIDIRIYGSIHGGTKIRAVL